MGARARALGAIQALEQTRQIGIADARCAVLDAEDDARLGASHADAHPPRCIGIARCVDQQIVEGLQQPARVAAHRQRILVLRFFQAQPLLTQRLAMAFQRLGQHIAQLDLGVAVFQRARIRQ